MRVHIFNEQSALNILFICGYFTIVYMDLVIKSFPAFDIPSVEAPCLIIAYNKGSGQRKNRSREIERLSNDNSNQPYR